jgi:predicted O-methyltransferase YrrM
VIELGSGFGYSAYWFTRAVGAGGRVVCTDGDAANRDLAEGFLARAGRWDRVDYRIGMAQDALRALPGPFDVVYNDIDKLDYPEAWLLARERIRPGGLYACDNVLWSGRVAEPDSDDQQPETTAAIRRHNELVASDPDFDAFLVPTRDGVLVARRR